MPRVVVFDRAITYMVEVSDEVASLTVVGADYKIVRRDIKRAVSLVNGYRLYYVKNRPQEVTAHDIYKAAVQRGYAIGSSTFRDTED